jgi:ferredoxin
MHVGHEEPLLRLRIPPLLLRLFTRYEHLFMRCIGFLAKRDWIYRNSITRKMVDSLSGLIAAGVNGEVLTLQEAREVIESVAEAGYTVAVGTCPCRRARNMLSDEVPNNSDMVFGPWADEYLRQYPGLYRKLELPEALRLLGEFDAHGFIHQVYGMMSEIGAATVICNCPPDVCIPLLAWRERGYEPYRKGRSRAVVDEGSCIGVDDCGACIGRCPFDARKVSGGKARVVADECYGCGVCVSTCRGGATTLQRRPGAEFVYVKHLVRS